MVESTNVLDEKVNELFLEDWCNRIAKTSIFPPGSSASTWKVSPQNIPHVLAILELDIVVRISECLSLLSFYENEEAPFEIFYKDLIRLMTTIADVHELEEEEDPEKILGAFATPAERIVKTLFSIKQKLTQS